MRTNWIHSREFSVGLALLALVLGLELGSQFMHGRTFFDAYNMARISRDFSFVGIAAIGAVMVIVSGGVDLSAGSVMGLSAVTFASLYTIQKWPPALCLAGAVSAGGLAGFINGALIGHAGLPPFIATLGMMSIAAGLSYMFTQGLNISILWKDDPSGASFPLQILGDHSFVFMLIAGGVAAVILARTVWGRYVYALGSNEECSRFSGLNVPWIKIGIYTAAGLFSGLAGTAYALRYGYAATSTGKGYELQIIAACVVGGASFSGGQGTAVGALLGACILQFLKEGLILYDVKEEYVQIVYGLTIVVAVAMDHLRGKSLFRKSS